MRLGGGQRGGGENTLLRKGSAVLLTGGMPAEKEVIKEREEAKGDKKEKAPRRPDRAPEGITFSHIGQPREPIHKGEVL